MHECEDCGARCPSALTAREHCNPKWDRLLEKAALQR